MSARLRAPGAGGMVFATVSNRPPGEVQVAWPFGRRSSAGCTLRTQYLSIGDAGAHAAFLSCSTWQWGARHGVNEHGVAIASRPGARRVVGDHPGLISADLVRLGLERGRTAEEAVEAMTHLLQTCGPDRASDTGGDETAFLAADPKQALVLGAEGTVRAWGSFLDGVAVTEGLAPTAAASLLRQRPAGPPGAGVPAASMIAELSGAIAEGEPLRVYVAPGSPTSSIFVPAFPRTAGGPPPCIPVELSSEELWHAADQLRAAVEGRPDALAEVIASLQPVEDELWADADEVLHNPAKWVTAGASWGSRALHALRSCIPSPG